MQSIESRSYLSGVTSGDLMKRAGEGIAARLMADYELKEIIILASSGNNGGDALVVADFLSREGIVVKLIKIGSKPMKTREGRDAFQVVDSNSGIMKFVLVEGSEVVSNIFSSWVSIDLAKYKSMLSGSEFIVDGIFGINLCSKVLSPYDEYLKVLSELNSYVIVPDSGLISDKMNVNTKSDGIASKIISIDIPSGLDCNSGRWFGTEFSPLITYTLQYSKFCLDELELPYHVIDINIDGAINNYAHFSHFIKFWRVRDLFSHKGSNGRVVVIGGSEEIAGAPSLASIAILRSSVDTVRTIVPSEISSIVASYSPNFLVIKAPGTHFHPKHLRNVVALSIDLHEVALLGMGITNEDSVKKFVRGFVKQTKRALKLVIDAEAIRAFQGHLNELKGTNAIITPHKAELSYLLQKEVPSDPQELIYFLEDKARDLNIIIVLKGMVDIITDGHRTILNERGHPGMTVGGTGDVLAGIIAASLCFIENRFFAAVVGSYIMGLAGEKAGKIHGNALLATDIVNHIPLILNNLEEKRVNYS